MKQHFWPNDILPEMKRFIKFLSCHKLWQLQNFQMLGLHVVQGWNWGDPKTDPNFDTRRPTRETWYRDFFSWKIQKRELWSFEWEHQLYIPQMLAYIYIYTIHGSYGYMGCFPLPCLILRGYVSNRRSICPELCEAWQFFWSWGGLFSCEPSWTFWRIFLKLFA